MRRRAASVASTTIRPATLPASPSLPDGPTSSSPGSTSCVRAEAHRVDVTRVHPVRDANGVAAEQAKASLGWSSVEGDLAPMFVFDAGYDLVKLQQGLEESSSCQILVRLRAGWSFYGDPSLSDPPAEHRSTASSRAEDEVLGPEHLARTIGGARMRGWRLRGGARASS